MKLLRFLNDKDEVIKKTSPRYLDDIDENEQKMLDYIHENVKKDYIDTVISTGVVYRYTNNKINNVFITVPIRTDRIPTNTPVILQEMLDVMFLRKFGWKSRSASAFASGDASFLGIYGSMQLFFPIGEYRFVWSPDVNDMYHTLIGIMDELNVEPEDGEQAMQKVADYFERHKLNGYTTHDLPKAIRSGNEIMFKCRGYVLVDGKYHTTIRGMLDEV